MAKIPPNPELIFAEVVADSRRIFVEELVSIILYGSGAGKDYIPGRSDLNLLIVLTAAGIERIEQLLEPVARWRKRNVATPLLMTRADFSGSQDAYPIEYLNMQRQHRLLCGEDLLAGLTFDPCHIRLQLERELRAKLLHLRSGYLATQNDADRIRDLIRASLTAFVSLFGALLYLRKAEIPQDRKRIIAAAAETAGLDASLFFQCEEIRKKTDRLAATEVRALFRNYMNNVSRLCEYVQGLTI
jgi:hypothetical protein